MQVGHRDTPSLKKNLKKIERHLQSILYHIDTLLFRLFFEDCGVRPLGRSNQGKIVGGKKSVFGDWPWQVRME